MNKLLRDVVGPPHNPFYSCAIINGVFHDYKKCYYKYFSVDGTFLFVTNLLGVYA